MESKIVKRYYKNKAGKLVEYTYNYNEGAYKKVARKKDTKLLVGKRNGKQFIYKKRKAELFAEYDSEDQIILEEELNQWLAENANTDNTLTIKSLKARSAETGIEIAILNTGYSLEEAADELGVTVSDLLAPGNWDGSIFESKRSDGTLVKAELVFNYNNSIWKKL